MIKLGMNIASNQIRRQLGRSTEVLSTASQRLSTGQRINKASDDAAGLSISMSLKADTRIFNQGYRNLNDGLSAANIADSAMGELGGIVIRIKELAEQSANGVYSAPQRAVLQNEVDALEAEWNRIVESTTFNGTYLLTGSNTKTLLQGGVGLDNSLAVQFGKEALAGGFNNYAGENTRVSTSSTGVEGNDESYSPFISANGRYIAFTSEASNLVSGDTNGYSDAFLRDTYTGQVTRVSTSSSGAEGDYYSSVNGISADGRYVTFSSNATNLVSNDTNGDYDVFVKDTLTGITTRVSTSAAGAEGNASTFFSVISGDGRYVAFSSWASNLVAGDTNIWSDIFLKDTQTGNITLVSSTSSGGASNGISQDASISADGRYVAFSSDATNLVSGDTNGANDIFVKDTLTGLLTRVNTSSAGVQGNAAASDVQISADGRYVVFNSTATNLVTGDTNGTQDLFRKDLLTGELIRVSVSMSGAEGNYWAELDSISADGRYVSFNTASNNFVNGDTNGVEDVFVKDMHTGAVQLVSTTTSGVQGDSTSWRSSISADGRYVTYLSFASNLVSGDTNGDRDIFLRDLTKAGLQQMAGMVVNNQVSARITLDLVDRYADELLEFRGKLGATTSRINTFLNTIASSSLNYQAASSRITDADIAEESSITVATTIKQQIGASLLGQANQEPGLALRLLQGA